MRIKLDENLSTSCAVRLTALGHDVHTVIEEELSGSVDSEVWISTSREAPLRRGQPGRSLAGQISRL
jgi:hypothetical protein